MSLFAEATVRRLAASARPCPTSAARLAVTARQNNRRQPFSASAPRRKTATEAAKDTMKTVGRVVSDKLTDGMDMGANVANKVKQAGEEIQSKAKGLSTEELKDEAQKKGREAHAEAKEKLGQAKAKVDETKKKYGM